MEGRGGGEGEGARGLLRACGRKEVSFLLGRMLGNRSY